MNDPTTGIDIDTLLANLNKEAELLAGEPSREQSFRPYNLDAPHTFAELVIPDPFVFKLKPVYEKEDFLRFDDAEFVTNAYRGLLRREPDENGLTEYLVRLRNGEDKIMILASLMYSDEGRRHGVAVRGMAPYVTLLRLLRKRAIGFFLKPVIDLCMLRPMVGRRVASLRSDLNQLARAELANLRNVTETSQLQFQRTMADIQQEKQRLLELKSELDELSGQLETTHLVNSQIKTLINDDHHARQRLLDKLAHQSHEHIASEALTQASELARDDRLDAFYRAFEDSCRGTENDIKSLFEVYLPDIIDSLPRQGGEVQSSTPVVDIGCGRGEWLTLLRENSIPAIGIDSNEIMVNRCRELELTVKQNDGLVYLQSQPSASVQAVTGFHVIEHLPFPQLFDLFDEARRVLVDGGVIIFETPNPENILVGSHTFYHDPSHRNPITPTFIKFMAEYFGFIDIEIRRLHPYPEEARVVGMDTLTERVNGHLCGPQDFAIIARKPPGIAASDQP
ncbi:MAG TPA: methyltransferase type 11 [Porticoccaceae bacterium]|nr:methyltransferase type 11 [Porticoccaceae bacterium]